ncbi:MAG: sigma-54-dependent Fis family transcriptional regulator [Acidobacteria bacterium]|nr:sigma-54-dependent Fis family transcriptional regulator [Acidobacteriota bacterium]
MSENETHLLLVEDEAPLRESWAERLAERGYRVAQAESGEVARERLAEFAFDVVITDLRLPGIDGAAVVETALERYPEIVAVVVTGYATVETAVTLIKKGVADFIEKPCPFDRLLHTLATALERRRLRSENEYLRAQLQQRYGLEGIVGESPPMHKLRELVKTVAGTTSTILVTGETGTGKELVARAIHHNSPRRREHFVALNCSAIPETLLEAELFGHVRGAFTGAVANRKGRFEQANRGTLFLDEIATMSINLQARLLRALQEREFERVGGDDTIKVDVRVIAATNANLAEQVEAGEFREDLYYRLNVIPIHLTPLRDRREDIPLLVQEFVARIGAAQTPPRDAVAVSQEAMRQMMMYRWPGNVRQLENVIERALALSPGRDRIEADDLPDEVRRGGGGADAKPALPDAGLDLPAYLQHMEAGLIHAALERTGGNKLQAARLLNIKRTTLVEKAKRLDPSAAAGHDAGAPSA